MYNENSIYIIGHGRTGNDNAITEQFKIFFIGFVVDKETDKIIDLGCSTTIAITEQFIKSMFIGKKIDKFDEEIEKRIMTGYFGSSQKAILIAYKDAVKKYLDNK